MELSELGLDQVGRRTLGDALKDINSNIVNMYWFDRAFFVKYKNGNMYHIQDSINEPIRYAINTILELQRSIIQIPNTGHKYFKLHVIVMTRYMRYRIIYLEQKLNEKI